MGLGSALRFYDYSAIPFTHDEFSALFRTGYSSFSQLIEEGVLVDFHPAGVQVFLHYYGSLFGFTEWILKLPFTLMGIGSIFLVYKIAKEWFNARTGLLAAAFISCTQYFVFYSQIARPYSAGLFFGLLALLYWKRFLFDGDKASIKNFILWIVFAALCAYIHYYLLLSLLIMSLIGLLMVPRSRRALYVLSGFAIGILYLPHLKIFLSQIKKGGVGSWLGTPDSSFISDYTNYVFQFNPYFITSAIVLVLAGLILSGKTLKFWWASLFFFGLSFSAGYFYSVYINPILQFSGLIFSFPFILMATLSLISYRKWLFYLGFASILGFGTYGLIKERQHYSIFYESAYEQIVLELKKVNENDELRTIAILDDRRDIIEYYLNKHQVESQGIIFTDGQFDINIIANILRNRKADQLVLGSFASSQPEIVKMAQHYYPNLLTRKSYFLGEFYHFNREKDKSGFEEYLDWEDRMPFASNVASLWKKAETKWFKTDSFNRVYLNINNENRFNPGITIDSPQQYIHSSNAVFDLEMQVSREFDQTGAHLAFSVQQKDEVIFWKSIPLDGIHVNSKDGLGKYFLSIVLSEKILKKEDLSIKSFLLNDEAQPLKLYSTKASFRKGNPKLYSLFTRVGH